MDPLSTHSTSNIYNAGDCIEFKRFDLDNSEYIISKGKIINTTTPELLEVSIYNNLTKSFNEGIHWVNQGSIIKHYPMTSMNIISARMILKEKWKNMIIREVKTIKTMEPCKITRPYINNNGFIRYKQFDSLEEAYDKTIINEYNNIEVHYKEYFGFTTHRSLRSNDIYCNQEIFFSRKCYGELNLNNQMITGDFTLRRGYKTIPPADGQYICGLVELGEKGLFYRKWFVCSPEFLTLWTMVCEPDHYSLKYRDDDKFITKDFEQILSELDTEKYLLGESRGAKFYNMESHVLYLPNIYQKIATSIFKPPKRNKDSLYKSFEERFHDDLVWMK